MYGKNLHNFTLKYVPDRDLPGAYRNDLVEQKEKRLFPPEEKYYCQYVGYRNFRNPLHCLFYLGFDYAYPDLYMPNRTKSALVFNCILKGKGVFNGMEMKAGDCYYSRPNQLHSMRADPSEPWVSIWFSIDGIIGKQTCEELDRISPRQKLRINNPEALFQLTNFYLYTELEVFHSDEFVLAMFHQLLGQVKSDISADPEDNQVASHLHPIINQALLYIEDSIQTVTVNELAARAHLEVKYFTKIFTAVVGISPQKHILKLKMKAAANCLATTDLSIEKISEMLGYQHRNGLAVAFKNAYGMSLTEYRNKYKKKHK